MGHRETEDAGDKVDLGRGHKMRKPLLGQSVPCAPNFAYLRNHEPTPLAAPAVGFTGVVGSSDSVINARGSVLGYTL